MRANISGSCKRVHVVLLPATAHALRRDAQRKIVYLWLWVYKDGYFFLIFDLPPIGYGGAQLCAAFFCTQMTPLPLAPLATALVEEK